MDVTLVDRVKQLQKIRKRVELEGEREDRIISQVKTDSF